MRRTRNQSQQFKHRWCEVSQCFEREKEPPECSSKKRYAPFAPEICPVLLMFSESAQLIVWKEKKKSSFLPCPPCADACSHLCVSCARFPGGRIPSLQDTRQSIFYSSVAGRQIYVFAFFFCTGVGRTTALQTGSSSPGCHGSWKLLRGVCRNPTGRSCALVYLCIGDGLGEMKAAKVGKSHPPLWLGNIWCVLTHKRNDSVQPDFTRRPTHSFFHPPSAAD